MIRPVVGMAALPRGASVSDSFDDILDAHESEQPSPGPGRFPARAYEFVLAGLGHTVKTVHGELAAQQMATGDADPEDESRHVSGQQLCLGLRDFAINRYGRLARTVLARWNIQSTDDFGRIVFDMIETKQLRKTDHDRFEDFLGVFDFDESFEDLSSSHQ
jgi:uncharacterized repeat protein (TIGR04138 family)